jgi:hypothetical protein
VTDYQTFLLKLNQNLQILREREAKYGGQPPLELTNQIEDHRQAIALTKQAIAGELTEVEWREALEPLLLPFWQGLSQAAMVIMSQVATGQEAAPDQTAGPAQEMLATILTHLRRTPRGEMLADGFSEDPETYEKPVAKTLTELIKTETDLATRLHQLLAAYEAAPSKPGYQATISGTGSVAQGKGASAATATGGGIAIGGSVKGDISLGRLPRSDDDE